MKEEKYRKVYSDHLALDKGVHRMVCFTISIIATCIAANCGMPQLFSMIIGLIFGMTLGILKEIIDVKRGKSKECWSWYDILADIEGSLLGSILAYVF